jgi:hypothetical protein
VPPLAFAEAVVVVVPPTPIVGEPLSILVINDFGMPEIGLLISIKANPGPPTTEASPGPPEFHIEHPGRGGGG